MNGVAARRDKFDSVQLLGQGKHASSSVDGENHGHTAVTLRS